ncbi:MULTISPECIES: glycosyltransferase family 4 protein [Gordonibacter]|uniref:Glycosyltransferase family 4 protein n=1 Tax=Gordonibacter faecis TaxID=3047475 RepID=A0ABT7DPI1_9ACTN|nr:MULTISPECIES: glycosyltransferase family 4 protein [unclassified Gordonibacter]MDJ1651137.1 glycosyltransferase family 4 protein [Gordonibacter sp. KGMB12511]
MDTNDSQTTLPRPGARPRAAKRIAVVTMGVKLGDETRGYTRFRFLSELLAREGFEVDLITSTFQHWDKAQRDCSKPCYQGLPYRIVFIEEPGYQKNLDLARILSHRTAAKNLRAHFEREAGAYDLIYAEIPPNDVARVCAEWAEEQRIPFVADINDLWPEAMRMVVDVPVLSDIAFYPFARDARRVYQLLSAAVGTSDEYAARPAKDREKPYPHITVYVGNDLASFDAGAHAHAAEVEKPAGEVWATYAGTLGASYDLATLVRAAALLEQERLERTAAGQPALPPVRVKVLGDGPDRARLEALAAETHAPVDFLGYMKYEQMAAWLCASDITVNSLVKSAAQSIVTKIGDYLASGNPLINTGSSPEFRAKVTADGFGVNVEAENPRALADELAKLAGHPSLRKIMGTKARTVAEREFDQPHSYQTIVDMLRTLL